MNDRKTSEEITCDRLKNLILDGKLPRGEFLAQRKLAESVGAALVTLRSSLRLLENDGLIENIPKWGVRIPLESENSIRERYYVRELLEVGAVEKILRMNNPAISEELEKKAAECDAIKRSDAESIKAFATRHADFHLAITRLCENRFLQKEIKRLNFRSMMLANARYGLEVQDVNQLETHHRDFVKAIFDDDHNRALDAVREHIRKGCIMELEALRNLNRQQRNNTTN